MPSGSPRLHLDLTSRLPRRVTSVTAANLHMAQRCTQRPQWRRSAALLLLCFAGFLTMPAPAGGQPPPPSPSPSPRYGSPTSRSDCVCHAPTSAGWSQGQSLYRGRAGATIYLQLRDLSTGQLARLTRPPVRTRPLRATFHDQAAQHQGEDMCRALGRFSCVAFFRVSPYGWIRDLPGTRLAPSSPRLLPAHRRPVLVRHRRAHHRRALHRQGANETSAFVHEPR